MESVNLSIEDMERVLGALIQCDRLYHLQVMHHVRCSICVKELLKHCVGLKSRGICCGVEVKGREGCFEVIGA